MKPQIIAYPDYHSIYWIVADGRKIIGKTGELSQAQRIALDAAEKTPKSRFVILQATDLVGVMDEY